MKSNLFSGGFGGVQKIQAPPQRIVCTHVPGLQLQRLTQIIGRILHYKRVNIYMGYLSQLFSMARPGPKSCQVRNITLGCTIH